jgi:NADH-quinone oxidoreductase subunit I
VILDPQNTPKNDSWLTRIYLWEILKGMGVTLKEMVKNVVFRQDATVQYPEEQHPARQGYRGEHILKQDEQGRVKCVACYMCATACPSECIKIVAGEAPWEDRDKYPVVFEIDMLRCIYCGYCESACPCDAIELTTKFNTVMTDRADAIYDKEKLLNNAPPGYVPKSPGLVKPTWLDTESDTLPPELDLEKVAEGNDPAHRTRPGGKAAGHPYHQDH